MLVYGVRLPDGRRVPGLLDIEGWNTRPPATLQRIFSVPMSNTGSLCGMGNNGRTNARRQQIDTTQLVSDISCLSSSICQIPRGLNAYWLSSSLRWVNPTDTGPMVLTRTTAPVSSRPQPAAWACRGPLPGDQYALGPNVAGTGPDSSSEVRLAALQRGDLLFWGRDGSEHEAIYAGNGMMYAAPHLAMSLSFNLSTGTTSGSNSSICGETHIRWFLRSMG